MAPFSVWPFSSLLQDCRTAVNSFIPIVPPCLSNFHFSQHSFSPSHHIPFSFAKPEGALPSHIHFHCLFALLLAISTVFLPPPPKSCGWPHLYLHVAYTTQGEEKGQAGHRCDHQWDTKQCTSTTRRADNNHHSGSRYH